MKRVGFPVLALLLAFAGCSVNEPDRLTLTPVPFGTAPGWRIGHQAEMLPDLLRNCATLARMPPAQSLGGEGEAAAIGGTAGQWSEACHAARRARIRTDARARDFFEANFRLYRVANNFRPAPLFTGYFEPVLNGDVSPTPSMATPLFATPSDLVQASVASADPGSPPRRVFGRKVGRRLEPYYSRMLIEDGALDGKAAAIAWLADPVALFFLQIQGSGRIVLPDGTLLRVGYAAQNGQPFVDIGRLLVKRGDLTPRQQTMQDVRQWLYGHPADSRAVMDANPSYVFFREVTGLRPDEGPIGAFGLPLSPLRSAAVDPRFIPLGAPLWIDTRDPVAGRKLQRLVLAQDTGGAIRGPARADLFFGWGDEAELRAGGMWGRGGEYILLPRSGPVLMADGNRLAPQEAVFTPQATRR